MRILSKFINYISIIVACFCLGVVMFVPMFMENTKHSKKSTYFTINLHPNIRYLIIAHLIIAFIYIIGKRFKIQLNSKLCFGILLALVIAVQVIYMVNVNFLAGNDALNLACGAKLLATGAYHEFYNLAYYQSCPNNLYAYALYILVYRIAAVFAWDGYLIMQIITLILGDLTLLMVYSISMKLTCKPGLSIGVSTLYALIFCISPWSLIPYTDQLSVWIPVLTLWIYSNLRDRDMNLFVKSFLIISVPILTYKLKALNIIVLIAIALVEVFRQTEALRWKKLICLILSIALALSLSFGLTKMVESYTNYEPNDRRELGLEWYFLLGSNYTSFGQWASEDYNLIAEGEMSRETKTNLAYGVVRDRYSEMGFTGILKHWCNKTNLFFNDGIFIFGQSRGSIQETHEKQNALGTFLANLFFPDENHGKYYNIYVAAMQLVWIMIFVPFVYMVFASDYRNLINLTIKITFVGLFFFFMLFECSPRLLIPYLPVMVLGAGLGYNQLFERIDTWRK